MSPKRFRRGTVGDISSHNPRLDPDSAFVDRHTRGRNSSASGMVRSVPRELRPPSGRRLEYDYMYLSPIFTCHTAKKDDYKSVP